MAGSILGNTVKRVEDPRFIRGEGRFVDDLDVEGVAHLVLVRSPVPHGVIESIDIELAESHPGVIGVFTADTLPLQPIRGGGGAPVELARPPLATDRVRFVGDVVAAVVAESAQQARDAADLVWPEIDLLPATARSGGASEGPLVHDSLDGNVVATFATDHGAPPLDGADVVVTATFENQRLAAIPLEGSGALARPDGDGVVIHTGSQLVHSHARTLASALGLEVDQVHAITPDTGGGFGPKFQVYVGQVLCAALARHLDRPVKWVETRSENLLDMCHGRDQVQRVSLAATSDGIVTGVDLDVTVDAGAYPTFGHRMPHFTMIMATGPYAIPNVRFRGRSVATHTTPTHAYRGAGRPEATAILERSFDMLAARLGIDPAELRRRNFLAPESFPLETPTGMKYDVGEYAKALDRALDMAGYEDLRAEQARRREAGETRVLGIGVASYVEVTDFGAKEWSSVELEADGTFVVRVGTGGTGQGHETAFAQIAGEVFGVPIEQVRVVHGDTAQIPRGGGTGGSRSLQVGGSAVFGASEGLADKARRLVAHLREASVDDVIITDRGTIGVIGVPDTELTWAELAAVAAQPGMDVPEDLSALVHEEEFGQENSTFPFGSHVSVVEVDLETGDTTIVRHIAVDDCGKILNRLLVDGQVHGGVAQGMGQALMEKVQYDDDANPLTTNLTTYLIPSATKLPTLEVDHTETPTPRNPLGAKGIGESGTIGSTAAVHNAVIDAVAHLGVEHIDMPVTPARIWEALHAAR